MSVTDEVIYQNICLQSLGLLGQVYACPILVPIPIPIT